MKKIVRVFIYFLAILVVIILIVMVQRWEKRERGQGKKVEVAIQNSECRS